jgi:signal transduction histidine kinase/ligand-binding sensor domain-containing protein
MHVRFIRFTIATLVLGWSSVTRALNPEVGLSEYKHLVWRSGDQGLTGQGYAVVQSGDGYVWVGTTAGLFRFDGVRFTEWKDADAASMGPSRLFRATDGSLWVSSDGKGLLRIKDRKVQTIDPNIAGLSDWESAVTEDEKGTVWYYNPKVGSGDLCYWGRGAGTHCLPSPYPLETGRPILSFADAILIGSRDGLVRFQGGKFTRLPIPGLESYPNHEGVVTLLPDEQNGVLVAVYRGPVGHVQVKDDTLTPVESLKALNTTLADVATLFRDREGALWIGTVNNGIYRIYGDRVDHYAAATDSTRQIIQFAEDQEGSIWFVSSAGLERLSERRVVTLANDGNFHFDRVDGVSVAHDGTLWVSGVDAFLTLAPGSRTFKAPAMVSRDAAITSIFEDHTGAMWVGVNYSLTRLEGQRFLPFKVPRGMIASLAEDLDFNLWAVSLGPPRQILKIDPSRLRVSPIPNLPPASRVAADPAGGIYVAALNGDLVHVDALGGHVVYPHPAGHSARIPQLSVARDGIVYASTSFGLEVLRNGKIQILDTNNGLPCKVLYDSIFDGNDNLWLYAQCGAIRIAKADFARWMSDPSAVIPTLLLDAEDGAIPFDAAFGGSARTPDGVLWFSNATNLQRIDPDSAARPGNPPPVHLEQFTANGKGYNIDEPIKLPPLTGDIQIDYSGLSFVAPDKMQFRYMLDGFDRGWTEAGPRRQAIYTTLPPGNYRFHVIACNNNGVWNDVGASLSFELAPAFYQTVWFTLACGIVTLALLWFILQVRIRQVARKVRLRQSIQYTERLRIARQLHDSLLQSVHGLMLRFASAAQAVPSELPVRRTLEELLDRSDDVIAEARHSIQDLREREKQSLDLAREIADLGRKLGGDESVPITVVTNGTPYELNADTHENVLLIAREAMLNSFKHASARALEVQVDYLKAAFKLSVRDNGRGIDEEMIKNGREGHWGLHGMRERAAAIHGRLRVLSKIGAGTEVVFDVPRIYASAK